MVSLDRWQAAQRYEQGYWQALADRIAEGSMAQLQWYGWRADQLAIRLLALGRGDLARGDARIVEVGCGPIGIASFFPASECVAVDPLEDFYGAHEVLSELRNPAVQYRRGVGEDLPCESDAFDLAVIDNCIDHVQDVHAVISEMHRVLRPGGVLYLTVNSRTWWGFGVHRILSRLRVDAGHPHTFTAGRARALLDGHGFRLLQCESASYLDALREDLSTPQLRARIKAVLGTSEFIVTVVAEKTGATTAGA